MSTSSITSHCILYLSCVDMVLLQGGNNAAHFHAVRQYSWYTPLVLGSLTPSTRSGNYRVGSPPEFASAPTSGPSAQSLTPPSCFCLPFASSLCLSLTFLGFFALTGPSALLSFHYSPNQHALRSQAPLTLQLRQTETESSRTR